MRNLLVLTAAFGLAGVAHAQVPASTSASVTQTGDDNVGTVNQSNGVNAATINQTATVANPASNGNFALVDQDGSHTASVTQVGDNDAEVKQFGGTGNGTTISQTGRFDRVPNSSYPNLLIRNYYAKSTQDGSDNQATITQIGGSGRVDVVQAGDRNTAVHDQGTASYSKTYITGAITQTGDDHEAYQYKQSTGGTTTMTISQTGGDNNTATQDISVLAGGEFRNGHSISAIQTGNDNTASQDLSDNYSQWSLAYADLAITQVGDDNTANQTSHYSNVRSAIAQTGEFNTADVTFGARGVSHTDRIDADVTQVGDTNDADIVMNSQGSATITQGKAGEASNGNQARIIANDVAPMQAVNALIEQYGAGSNVALVDMADGASIDVLQDGSTNQLLGLGGVGAAQVLNGSSLTVDQIGSTNDAFVSLTNGGTGTVDQNGAGNTATIDQQ